MANLNAIKMYQFSPQNCIRCIRIIEVIHELQMSINLIETHQNSNYGLMKRATQMAMRKILDIIARLDRW